MREGYKSNFLGANYEIRLLELAIALQSDILHSSEGIVGENSINRARMKFPLEEFYALVDEISWV